MVDFVDSDDVATRGELIYQERLRTDLERDHLHQFVAIEPDSGDHFLGKTLTEAAHNSRKVYPDRLVYVVRIGHAAAIHMGQLSW